MQFLRHIATMNEDQTKCICNSRVCFEFVSWVTSCDDYKVLRPIGYFLNIQPRFLGDAAASSDNFAQLTATNQNWDVS